jgi:hypothetical protein
LLLAMSLLAVRAFETGVGCFGDATG